jgi:phage gp36-like protein
MPYATASDLYARYDESEITALAARDGAGASVVTVIEAALASAGFYIDGFVAAQYALPVTPTPPLLTELACTIARYRLWKDRASEQVRQDYEDAIDMLRRIAAGTVRLPSTSGGATASTGSIAVQGRAAVFTDELLALMP